MSIAAPLRGRLEAILFDGYGSTGWTIATGHFHRRSPDRPVDQHDLASVERAVEVSLRLPRSVLEAVADAWRGYGLYRYPVEVVVGYALTGGGGDDPERAGEISGSAEQDDVEDRAQTDRHLIEGACCYWGNLGGLDPHVIDCRPVDGGGLEIAAPLAVLTVPLELWCRAALPGAYGPTL